MPKGTTADETSGGVIEGIGSVELTQKSVQAVPPRGSTSASACTISRLDKVKRVAVVADATSSGYFFPHWHCYYGGQFGAKALNVITYRGQRSLFDRFPLGSLIEEMDGYDDVRRALRISSYVAQLLKENDVVIRCDIDEFLVPAPQLRASLSEYIEILNAPYVTAIGLDLVEAPGDKSLDLSRPLLTQRPWCVETSSLSKTAIVTRDAGTIVWAAGFHSATVVPRFDNLYLLHMKFADVKGRIAWFATMRAQLAPGSETYAYYDGGKAKIEGYAAHLNSFPRVEGADPSSNTLFRRRFAASVIRNPLNGIFQGDFVTDHRQVRHNSRGVF